MIKVEIGEVFITSLLRDGMPSATDVVEDRLPEEAELSDAVIEQHPTTTLVLYFEDGKDEYTKLEPIFREV